MADAQENIYGRGKRSRNSSKTIDYRQLAGEVSVFDVGTTNSGEDTNDSQECYANKHIIQVLNRDYEDASSILQTIRDGKYLTVKNLVSPECPLTIERPMLITDSAASIGMETFQNEKQSKVSIVDFGNLIGMSHPVTVLDVRNQDELEGWNFGDLVDYFTDEDRLYTTNRQRQGSGSQRVLNQISLEFSHTPLRKKFTSPSFVRELDWIDIVWPRSKRNHGDFPRVQYYCLTSTAGCYTDFHVDFGGTSVYYHIHSGRKTFLLIPPTDTNLALYEKWLCSKNQNDIFFPDMEQEVMQADGCGSDDQSTIRKEKVGPVLRVTIEESQTFIIPSAWIHAVYTPVDSIVIGGNFLHGLEIKRQLDVHCLETRTRVPAKFRFPSFVRLMWYAGVYYYKKMFDPNKYGELYSQEIEGLCALVKALKTWSVQPRDDKNVDSLSSTMSDCLAMVRAINHNIKDCKELCLALEMELDRVKTGIMRPKLKISLKKSYDHSESNGCILSERNQVKGGNRKLKLQLNRGTIKHENQSEKMIDLAPSVLSNSIKIKKRNPKIGDLASKYNLNQDMDDEEWIPGKKRSIKLKCLSESQFSVTSHLTEQETMISTKKKKLNIETSHSHATNTTYSKNQIKSRREVQVKKNTATRKKKTSTVRERLMKKFSC